MPTAYLPYLATAAFPLFLAAGESTIPIGSPVTFDTNPTSAGEQTKVKLTADGARPDAVVTVSIDLGAVNGGRGLVRTFTTNRCLLGTGGATVGDLLKVKSGKFVKCAVGDTGWFRVVGKPGTAFLAGDLVNVEPSELVVV